MSALTKFIVTAVFDFSTGLRPGDFTGASLGACCAVSGAASEKVRTAQAIRRILSEECAPIAAGTAKGGKLLYDAKVDGVGYAPLRDWEAKLPSDTLSAIQTAFAAMKAGTLVTCPPAPECGKTPAPPIGD